MSKKHKRRYGWTCPLCGIAYAPWVMSCECEKVEYPHAKQDEVPCSYQCGTSMEAEEVRTPCQQMSEDCPIVGQDAYMKKSLGSYRMDCLLGYQNSMSDYPCRSKTPTESVDDSNLRAKVQPLSYDNAALLDQLTRWREVCQQACGGSEELCATVDDRCVQAHDEAVQEERQQANSRSTPLPDYTEAVTDGFPGLPGEGDSPPRTLRFEVKNMQTLEAEVLQHQQDAAPTNPATQDHTIQVAQAEVDWRKRNYE